MVNGLITTFGLIDSSSSLNLSKNSSSLIKNGIGPNSLIFFCFPKLVVMSKIDKSLNPIRFIE